MRRPGGGEPGAAAAREASARATAMKAGRARGTRDSRRDAAPPAGSGRRGRRSTTPRATRPRPRPAAAARRGRTRADPRSGATDRCRGQSATAGARSRRTATARRARRRRRARPAQPCPSSGSCRRACAPSCRARQPSAASSPGADADRGAISAPYACCRSAICPGLDCVVIGGGGGLRADRRRRTNSPTPPAARGRDQRPMRPCHHHRHARRPGLARAGGKLRMALGSCHGYRACPQRQDYELRRASWEK